MPEKLNDDTIYNAMLTAAKYGVYIYNQLESYTVNNDAGEFSIKYPYQEVPENGIVFMLPNRSSIESDPSTRTYNKLIFKTPTGIREGRLTYTENASFKIKVENLDGSLRYATKNDIISNRLCAFRFLTRDKTIAILINNPDYNSISCSSININGTSRFSQKPDCYFTSDGKRDTFALDSELKALKEEVEILKNKISFGTEDANQALADQPIGSIYIRIKED